MLHVNGRSIDTLYVSRAEEENFIKAMKKFKFREQRTGNDGTHSYEGTKQDGRHNDHLHSGFDESSIIVKKEK